MSTNAKRILAGVLAVVALYLVVRMFNTGPDVASLAESSDPEDRLEAAVQIADGAAAADSLLSQLSADENEAVAIQAINVLGRRKSEKSRLTLTQLIDRSKQPKVRGAAAAALGHHEKADPQILVRLLDKNKTDRTTRAGAAKGLARLAMHGRKETAPVLLRALSHEDAEVRAWAIQGIYNLSKQKFPGYDASKPGHEQAIVINFIQRKLREGGLLP